MNRKRDYVKNGAGKVKENLGVLELRYKEKRVAQLGPLKRAMDLRRNLEV